MADPEAIVAAAEAAVDRDRLVELCAAMVDIASPTGNEGPLARLLASEMTASGLDGRTQDLTKGSWLGGDMANAYGRWRGDASDRSLMLYAPLDTVTTGDPAEDLPWAGPNMRADMTPAAETRDGLVIGLGAQNPKGHGACVLVAGEALAAVEAPLGGDLLFGFGAGGMPTNRRRPGLHPGHGVGCAALVDLVQPDEAVIAKTGWAISWEEVGLMWFTVEVEGAHTYVGSRHLLPYRNAIADASHIVSGLERWFPTWAESHRDGLVAPQGVVASIEAGWERMAAFTPAVCRFSVDLRISPRTTPDEAARAFISEVERLAREIGAEATCSVDVTIPGTTTSPSSPIITSAIRCWEDLEGRAHQPIAGLSGATDANILRSHGVPTARVGLPKVSSDRLEADFQLGMNAVDVDDMERLTKLLIRIAVDRLGVGDGSGVRA
ncbi:MAG: peptidase dimerization domain-containing protein [Ilumatobacter sp.]|nr:peptidase dimerization domain-containing protein [Ilumatobacter sp.]